MTLKSIMAKVEKKGRSVNRIFKGKDGVNRTKEKDKMPDRFIDTT